jgi:hypothetical protein
VAPEGPPLTAQVRPTAPVSPFDGVTDIVEVLPVVAPAVTLMLPLLLSAKLGSRPVPFRLTVCGEPVALSAMLIAATKAPDVVGEKVAVMLQVEPAASATLVEHVLVSLKELAFAPVTVMPLMLSGAEPVFLRITGCVVDVPTTVPAKVIDVGVSPTPGAATDVPESKTISGEPAALFAIFIVAASVPVATGVNVTLIWQESAGPSSPEQLSDSEKELAAAPIKVIGLIVRSPVPEFFSVTA